MAIDTETQRLMTNWARWRLGMSIRIAMTAAYSLEGRGPRADVAMPLFDGEAVEVNQAVDLMAEELRQAVVEYWLKSEPVERKAARCLCTVRRFYKRLDRAHAVVREHRRQLHDKGARIRRALAENHHAVFVQRLLARAI